MRWRAGSGRNGNAGREVWVPPRLLVPEQQIRGRETERDVALLIARRLERPVAHAADPAIDAADVRRDGGMLLFFEERGLNLHQVLDLLIVVLDELHGRGAL